MHCLIKTNLYSIIFLKKDLKSKKHLITAMNIETTILDFQLSNTFEQYESHMNAEEQQLMFKEIRAPKRINNKFDVNQL
jgi:hypothetical protein